MKVFRYVLKVLDADGTIRWFFLSEKQTICELEDYICRNGLTLIYRFRLPFFIIRLYEKCLRVQITADIYRNMALLASSDIPLLEALEIVLSTLKGRERKLLKTIKGYLEMGYSFSKSLMVAKISDPFAQNLIQAGEKIGKLAQVLEEIALYKEWQREVRSKLIQSLIYPFLLVLMICLVLSVLMYQLIPQLIDFYGINGMSIPASLSSLLSIMTFFTEFGDIVLMSTVCICTMGIILIKKLISFRLYICRFFLKIPLFGTIYSLSYFTRFYKNLSLQLTNHVDLIQALQSLLNTHESYCYPQAVDKVIKRLESGDPLSSALERAGLLNSQDARLLGICEKSGKIAQGIHIISTKTVKMLQHKITQYSENLKPMLILCFGCLLGAITYAVFVPLYESISLIQ